MKKFEYQVLTFTCCYIEDELNKYGQDGWELVAVDGNGKHYLKREIIE
ncbi:hypothetical protein [Romboutsia sp.]|nr:hypothetical protein [Romboutsia sp.]HSQ89555.1 hypothetical protein [Romboutsia sp.]